MIFHKTSTSGNDFIIVDRVEFAKLGRSERNFTEEICDKVNGAGADGVIFFSPEDETFSFSIKINVICIDAPIEIVINYFSSEKRSCFGYVPHYLFFISYFYTIVTFV